MIMTVFEGQWILFQAMRQNIINPFNKIDISEAFKKNTNNHKIFEFPSVTLLLFQGHKKIMIYFVP